MHRPDYLRLLSKSRTIPALAERVRAHATVCVTGISGLYPPQTNIDLLRKYELDAQAVERSQSLREAKKYLREKGYGN